MSTEALTKPTHPWQIKGQPRRLYSVWVACRVLEAAIPIAMLIGLLILISNSLENPSRPVVNDGQATAITIGLAVALVSSVGGMYAKKCAWWHIAGTRKRESDEPRWVYFARTVGVEVLSAVALLLTVLTGKPLLCLGATFLAAIASSVMIVQLWVEFTILTTTKRELTDEDAPRLALRRVASCGLALLGYAVVIATAAAMGVGYLDRVLIVGVLLGAGLGLMFTGFDRASRRRAPGVSSRQEG